MRKILLTLMVLALVFCLSITPFSASAAKGDNTESVTTSQKASSSAKKLYKEIGEKGNTFEVIGQTDKAELYMTEIEDSGVVFAIKNKETGAVWYSVKNDVLTQLGESPMFYNYVFELINITYMGGEARESIKLSASSTMAFENDAYTIDKIENGVRITMTFDDGTEQLGFTVPVAFTVVDDHFDVTVEFDGITKREDCTYDILTIGVMKYMASSTFGEENYSFIPDGSGALVYNNNPAGVATTAEHHMAIYGSDAAKYIKTSFGNSTEATLPVFGAKCGEDAVVAIIDQDAAVATVRTMTAKEKGYSYVYTDFAYRVADEIVAAQIWEKEQFFTGTAKYTTAKNAKVSYYPLTGDKADYMGMAEVYRDYILAKRNGEKSASKDIQLYIDALGAITKPESSFGVIVDKTRPLTTFEQAGKMVSELSEEGVKTVNLRFEGWQGDGLGGGAITNAKISKVVGDKESLAELKKIVESANGKLFLDADVVNADSSKWGYSTSKISIRDIVDKHATQYYYYLNSGNKNEENPYYIVTPIYLQEQVDKFMADADKYGLGTASFGTLGSSHYSDFSKKIKKFSDAEQTADTMAGILEGLSKDNTLLVDQGNSYSLAFADVVAGVEMYDTGLNIDAVDIPFVQIALHGVIDYTETAHNLSADVKVQFLRQLETGTMPYYMLTEADPSLLAETAYDYIYSSRYDVWKSQIINDYKVLSSILDGYGDKYITNYEYLSADKLVRATTYGEDLTVVVNYSEKDFVIDGQTVKAGGYLALTEEV